MVPSLEIESALSDLLDRIQQVLVSDHCQGTDGSGLDDELQVEPQSVAANLSRINSPLWACHTRLTPYDTPGLYRLCRYPSPGARGCSIEPTVACNYRIWQACLLLRWGIGGQEAGDGGAGRAGEQSGGQGPSG
jgi:hypothetical protein